MTVEAIMDEPEELTDYDKPEEAVKQAEEPEAEPQAEPAEEPQAEEEPPSKEREQIENLNKALRAERTARREEAERLRYIQSQQEQDRQRLQEVLARINGTQQERPSYDENPIEAVKQRDAEFEQRFARMEHQQRASAIEQQVSRALESADNAGRQKYGDAYDKAVDHIIATESRRFEVAGVPPGFAQTYGEQFAHQQGRYPTREELVDAAARTSVQAMANTALMENRDLAESAMELAKATGFVVEAPASPTAPQKPGADAALDQLREAQKATGLNGKGRSVSKVPTPEEAASFTSEEWEASGLGTDEGWAAFIRQMGQ